MINRKLNTDFLKLLAIISMLVDHVGVILFDDQITLRIIGRIAYPIFAYLVALGTLRTSNANRYIARLLIFGIISQPIYMLAFATGWDFTSLNIFFHLAIGAILIIILEKKYYRLVLLILGLSALFDFEYGVYGHILILLFYLYIKNIKYSLPLIVVWLGISAFNAGDSKIVVLSNNIDIQVFALTALPLILFFTSEYFQGGKSLYGKTEKLCHGERSLPTGQAGRTMNSIHPSTSLHKVASRVTQLSMIRLPRYFFYAFYPAHLLILFMLESFL